MMLKKYWPGISFGVIIFILSGMPGNFFPKVQSFWDWIGPDKIMHLGLYATFSIIMLNDIRKQYPNEWQRGQYLLIPCVIGTIFGGIMELMQHYIFIGRNGNVYDFVANVIGCIIGTAVFWLFRLKILNKS